jgi:hypothetical protein
LASRTLGSSFSWNNKGRKVSCLLASRAQDIPDHLLVLSELTLQLDGVFRGRWRFYLAIVVKDIPDHLLVLGESPPHIAGAFTWQPNKKHMTHSRPASSTLDWWRFYLTMVVDNIPDHLLVLGEPTLQTDDVFTRQSHERHSWPSSHPVWSSTPDWWRFYWQ